MRTLTICLYLLIVLSAPVVTAAPITYVNTLSGANEVPPNNSPATGLSTIIFDPVAQTLDLTVSFSGLLGTTTAAHIHCCTAVPGSGNAGVATTTPFFAGFPTGVTSGSFHTFLDLTLASSYNPAFVTAHTDIAGAEAFLANGILSGEAYLNIHSTTFGGGEIRAFLTPEPGTTGLVGVALAGLLVAVRRRSAQRA